MCSRSVSCAKCKKRPFEGRFLIRDIFKFDVGFLVGGIVAKFELGDVDWESSV